MAGAQPTRERARARVQGREASSLPLAAPPTLRHPLTPHPHSPPSPIQCAKQIQALHVAAAELRSLKPERVSALRARTGADGASTRPPHELSSLPPLTPPRLTPPTATLPSPSTTASAAPSSCAPQGRTRPQSASPKRRAAPRPTCGASRTSGGGSSRAGLGLAAFFLEERELASRVAAS